MGRRRFADLLTVGGRLYHETHFAPLLRMQGEVGGIALELKAADGGAAAGAGHLHGQDGDDGRAAADPHHGLRRPRPPRLRAGTAARTPGGRGGATGRPRTTAHASRLAVAACSAACCPPTLPDRARDAGRRATTTRPRPTRSAATSTTCSPSTTDRWGFFLGDVCGKGAERRGGHVAGPLHPARGRRPRPRPGRRAGHPEQGPARAATPAATPGTAPSIFGARCTPDAGRRRPSRWPRGGHPPPCCCARTAPRDYLPTPGGMLVGVLPDARVHHRQHRAAPRRHAAALHRRPDRGPHRTAGATSTARTPCAPSPHDAGAHHGPATSSPP